MSPLFVALTLISANCEHDARTFRCVKFQRNYDGDTITVDIPQVPALFGKGIAVRLKGIDTAELKTKDSCEKNAGRITKKFVQNLLERAKQIDLADVERDKYFRILADVRVDGKSISELLIKNRLAVAYDGGTKSKTNWCAVTDRTAGHSSTN